MRRMGRRLRRLIALAARGEIAAIGRKLRNRLWSDKRSIVLRRELSQDVDFSALPVTFSIRPYVQADAASLFDANLPADQIEHEKLDDWFAQGLTHCYVAVLDDGRATFVQWICTPSDNKSLHRIFDGALPVVEPGTILLEGAYTPIRFRRLPIMPAAMARIAEEGRNFGARWALVSVGDDNESMLKAAKHAGFAPWRSTFHRRRLLFRSVSHHDFRKPRNGPVTMAI